MARNYFNENGELNRSRLAQLVFADPEERRRLDGLIHPRVEAELQARVAELERRGVTLVLVEVPLLFETGREAAFDRVIVVAAPEALQIRRLQGAGPPRGGGDSGHSCRPSGLWPTRWPGPTTWWTMGGRVACTAAAGEKHLGGAEKSA